MPQKVPQGSVLELVIHPSYIHPLGHNSSKYGIHFHCYEDDT